MKTKELILVSTCIMVFFTINTKAQCTQDKSTLKKPSTEVQTNQPPSNNPNTVPANTQPKTPNDVITSPIEQTIIIEGAGEQTIVNPQPNNKQANTEQKQPPSNKTQTTTPNQQTPKK